MIIVYDLGPATLLKLSEFGASPFVRTVVFILRYKQLPYELKPLDLTSIEPTARVLGAPPTSTTGSSGSPKFTVPIIRDTTTGKVISDSTLIAEYLDTAYPDTPIVLPPGSRVLQKVFQSDFYGRLGPLYQYAVGPKTVKYFPEDVQARFGSPEPTKEQVLEAFHQAGEKFGELSQIITSSTGEPSRKFITGGKRPTFGDFSLVAFVYPLKFLYEEGEESEEWSKVRDLAHGWIGWEIDSILKLVL
ncbi:hypothetical protein PM082_002279 [Marasmius tenuissimus]|nr:hypothetical protein PM082_002279 [Marasmius tenuissimus]